MAKKTTTFAMLCEADDGPTLYEWNARSAEAARRRAERMAEKTGRPVFFFVLAAIIEPDEAGLRRQRRRK